MRPPQGRAENSLPGLGSLDQVVYTDSASGTPGERDGRALGLADSGDGVFDMNSANASSRYLLWSIAILGGLYAVLSLGRTAVFTSRAEQIQGVVSARGPATFTIDYEVQGQRFSIEVPLPRVKGSSKKRSSLQPGASVTVLYDPRTPARGVWKSNREWVFPTAILVVSLLAAYGANGRGAARAR